MTAAALILLALAALIAVAALRVPKGGDHA